MLVLGDGFGTCELSALFASSPSPLRKAESVVTTGLLRVRGALAAALLLAVVMLVLAAGSADAAFPGQNGRIAFAKGSFGGGIFTINPDGSGQERIGPKYGHSPSWSADGQKVVFVGSSGEGEMDFNQDIYVMDADGSNVQPVTTSARAYEYSPSFFLDGETIAFVRESERNGTDIFAKKIGDTTSTQLTDDPGFIEDSVAVSPEGQRIAYSRFSNSRGSDVFVMGADGSDPTNLTTTRRVEEFEVDWSPDGEKLAFTSYRFSWSEVGLAARAAEAQEGGGFTPEAMAREASGSKESTAEPGGEPEEDIEISVMNDDGSERRNLTASRAYDASPAFSPSGNKIVFSRATFNERSEKAELVVMRADGTNKRQITDSPRTFEYGADWQPVLLSTS
jgi:Tol biopolymer transport system component